MKKYLAYLKHNFKLGIKQAWIWLGVAGKIIGVVISLTVGMIQGKKDALLIALWTVGIILVLWILTTLIFIILIVPYEENTKQNKTITKLNKAITDLKKEKEEPPELKQLLELRTEGVQIRNKGQKIGYTSLVRAWIEAYEDWNRRVINSLSRLSKSQAAWFETLDTVPASRIPLQTTSAEHRRYFNIFCEKLNKLDTILRGYLKISKD